MQQSFSYRCSRLTVNVNVNQSINQLVESRTAKWRRGRCARVFGAEELQKEKEKCKVVNNELDATFAELTGF